MLKIYKNKNILALKLANFVLKQIKKNKNIVIGCPSGRSLKRTYYYIGKLSHNKKIDLSHIKIIMMDEYVIKNKNKNKKYFLCKAQSHYSCVGYAHRVIKKLFNYKKDENHKLKTYNIHFPNVVNPQNYDQYIKKLGGIDIFFLASGSSDGHVAFNNSKTSLNSSTHIIKLSNSTRNDNLKTFTKFKSINEVPKYGVTVGLSTIYKYSKIAILVLTGKEKRKSTTNILRNNKFNKNWPSTIIYKCEKKFIYIDELANSFE